jgi:hypothetical protein
MPDSGDGTEFRDARCGISPSAAAARFVSEIFHRHERRRAALETPQNVFVGRASIFCRFLSTRQCDMA